MPTIMMFLSAVLGSFAALASFACAFPNFPFYTDGRWIRDSTGAIFTYIGVNWPGAADTMLPEGLQYQSVQTIVGKIKSSGFNQASYQAKPSRSLTRLDLAWSSPSQAKSSLKLAWSAWSKYRGTLFIVDMCAKN